MAYQSRSKSATQGKEETAQMDYTHTEAHQMAYDFSVYLHEKMKKFPHYEKFTLQKDIRESIDGILDEIEMFEITKVASHLYAADRLKRRLVRKIRRYISDKALLKILDRIIDHNGIFPPGVGIPVGNLTSQLFANVYLNKLDQYVKHVLKMKYYVRYMDDFIILSEDPEELRHVLALIEEFLRRELKLELNPKTTILAAKNGINFVGYIHFKDHKRVRKDAMRRLKKLLKAFDTGEVELEDFDRSIESRFGHMKHADSYILIEETKEKVKEIKERKATA